MKQMFEIAWKYQINKISDVSISPIQVESIDENGRLIATDYEGIRFSGKVEDFFDTEEQAIDSAMTDMLSSVDFARRAIKSLEEEIERHLKIVSILRNKKHDEENTDNA